MYFLPEIWRPCHPLDVLNLKKEIQIDICMEDEFYQINWLMSAMNGSQ
jgi:hypothetical protein